MQNEIHALLEPYARQYPELECDGFTRVSSFLLYERDISHQILRGFVVLKNRSGHVVDSMPLHYWIEIVSPSGIVLLDYRLAGLATNKPDVAPLPYGVFRADDFAHLEYSGFEEGPCTNELIFKALTVRFPIPSQWRGGRP